MTVKTDFHAVDQQGTRDFVFQCHKRPFAMTVSPLFPNTPENLIDLELVEFLNIPIKKIEARRFHFAGIDTRIVGHISQTVQCVVKGKICGTTHLKAAVVRHMTKLFNLDLQELQLHQDLRGHQALLPTQTCVTPGAIRVERRAGLIPRPDVQ